MERQEVFEKVKKIIVNELSIEADKVTEDSAFETDLGADSLDAIELFCSLEDEFGLTIADEDAMSLKTVGAVVSYICEHE